ncbi:unnamed protein product [Blepharisma stoltei]|uniref:Uncharacterized protein n=1 Tax=Blepharisma stoltei TaxID=1481888 RepID=A0AAU9JD75_9CILI|nr:unnamed protein product [Blepharisma stoltei]
MMIIIIEIMSEEESKQQPDNGPVKAFAFHDFDKDKELLVESKALVKKHLEGVEDEKIQNYLLNIQNQKLQKDALYELVRWAFQCKNKILMIELLKILYYYKDLPYKILENAAARFFIDTFKLSGPESIFFSEKESGLQLGRKIVITISPSESRKYFIKTQRYGALSDLSMRSELKELDPIEAFVYYLLYQLNLGPEVRFSGKIRSIFILRQRIWMREDYLASTASFMKSF